MKTKLSSIHFYLTLNIGCIWSQACMPIYTHNEMIKPLKYWLVHGNPLMPIGWQLVCALWKWQIGMCTMKGHATFMLMAIGMSTQKSTRGMCTMPIFSLSKHVVRIESCHHALLSCTSSFGELYSIQKKNNYRFSTQQSSQ